MIEIEYSISDIKTSMRVLKEHVFCLNSKEWVTADKLNIGDVILSCTRSPAKIERISKSENSHALPNLKMSHNHHYFLSPDSAPNHDTPCTHTRSPLEQIPYTLANKPSNFPDGTPTGNHAGPWVAAKYLSHEPSEEIIVYAHANDHMCAEDAAVNKLREKLGNSIELHQGNVVISHAYVRKYTKKGRLVNTISPCTHCRNNYGLALNDKTMGTSDLDKKARGYLPSKGK